MLIKVKSSEAQPKKTDMLTGRSELTIVYF